MMSTARSEALWVLRAQSGDAEALASLLGALRPSLVALARTLVTEADVEDVVQETLIRVYRKLGQLTDPELLRPWAFRIATRLALRHRKYEARWLDMSDEAT